jgi:hypothetical protein
MNCTSYGIIFILGLILLYSMVVKSNRTIENYENKFKDNDLLSKYNDYYSSFKLVDETVTGDKQNLNQITNKVSEINDMKVAQENKVTELMRYKQAKTAMLAARKLKVTELGKVEGGVKTGKIGDLQKEIDGFQKNINEKTALTNTMKNSYVI